MSWSLVLPEISTIWLVLALIVLLLSVGVSIYFASKRLATHPKRRAMVIVLNILASVALIGLVADIRLSKSQISQAWLFSAGSLPQGVEELQKLDAAHEAKLFVLHDVAKLADNELDSAHIIHTPAQILDWQPELQHLTVVGDGLSATQWPALTASNAELKIDFLPSAPLTGLVNMRWHQQLVQGENLEVSGQLQIGEQDKNPADLYELSLVDPMGNKLVEQNLREGEDFIFNALPPTTGRWLYQLRLRDPEQSKQTKLSTEKFVTEELVTDALVTETLVTENIAVSVQRAQPVKLLIYQSAPSFETRQLRQWAGSFANPVTVISQISKNKHLSQHFNITEPIPSNIELMTQDQLNQFDLVVMDGRALSLISQAQWSALKQAVQQGLGLLLLADQSLPAALELRELQQDKTLASNITLNPITTQGEAQTVVPNWPNSQIEQAIQAQTMQLIIKQGTNLVMGDQQQTLVSMLSMGLGHIGVSLINNTYQWQTSGMATQYSTYWQYLLSKLAANRQSAYWLTQDKRLLLNQHSATCVLSQTADPVVQLQGSNDSPAIQLNLAANTLQQDRYCVSYWPQHLGWQQLKLLSRASHAEIEHGNKVLNSVEPSIEQNQYVYGQHNWLAWQQQQKHQASHYQAKLSKTLTEPMPQQQSDTLSKLWAWLLWLLCCTLLWIERKKM
ncbi:hypothetical protein [Paraglaciecola sp.]|uniref:hypothetical protein n=1 Tax=Paraglaciecola sp. TaxID=1920173 RepID=UPI0030F44689